MIYIGFMRRNLIWLIFILVISLFALWFVIKAGHSVISYFGLKVQVPTKIEKWTIEEIKSDEFALNAHFSFEYQGTHYQGVGRVGALFPNPWAAQRAQVEFSEKKWPAWINPRTPQKAVLMKKFPAKQAVSAVILIALLIYFIFLSFYVKKVK